jgi:DNA-binding GntR family transcriptional regulator
MSTTLLRDKIYAYVAKNVQNGLYTPAVKICEEHVAQDLGVSRTPVRAALCQLAAEGILERIPRHGFYVKKPEKEKSKEVFAVLGYLDSRVAELVCHLLTHDDTVKMEEAIAKMDVAIPFSNFADYSVNQNLFHQIYQDKCPNQTLLELLRSQMFSHVPHTYVGGSGDLFACFARTNLQHREILDAFTRRDLSVLAPLVERHWADVEYEQFV